MVGTTDMPGTRTCFVRLPGLEDELHGHPLDHLHEVPRRVLRRQQGEDGARARLDRVDAPLEDDAGVGVDRDRGRLARPHLGEIGLLEVPDDPHVT